MFQINEDPKNIGAGIATKTAPPGKHKPESGEHQNPESKRIEYGSGIESESRITEVLD